MLVRALPAADLVLKTMAQARVTKLVTVPTVLKNILDTCGKPAKNPACRRWISPSAPRRRCRRKFSKFKDTFGIELFDSIGSSEITYEWIANRQQEFRRGSLGKPVFGCEVRLGEPGRPRCDRAEPARRGLDQDRTACFFYWRKYDKSRETFVGEWARTGDNLYFDEDGYFWFSGRDNDMFKVTGLWVAPIEIEAALTATRRCGRPPWCLRRADGLTKPAPMWCCAGFCAKRGADRRTAAAVRPLGGYKVPARFSSSTLPRTTLMKIDRRALRATDLNRSAG